MAEPTLIEDRANSPAVDVTEVRRNVRLARNFPIARYAAA